MLSVAVASACILFWHFRADAETVLERPNVVLMVVDTLRGDRVEAERNGHAVMPGLQQLSREGWYFRRAVSQSSWTKPSVASALTGLYPRTHGLTAPSSLDLAAGSPEPVEGLPPEKETAAAFFKRHGYATFGVQTNRLLTAADGFAASFDSYHELVDTSAHRVNNTVYSAADKLQPPFFMYLHYMDPHAPYNPPGEFREKLGPPPALEPADIEALAAAGKFSNYYMDLLRNQFGLSQKRQFPTLSAAGREYFRALYDGDCRYLDELMKAMHAAITRRWPETIFVITADHGEELWEHGSVGHGRTLYSEVIHVPLVVLAPGRVARVVDTPVEGVDLLPTMAALSGLPPSSQWQGRSLVPEALEERPVFSETGGMLAEANVQMGCVIQGNMKLLRHGDGREEFYRVLPEAPVTPDQAVAAQLRKALEAHHAEAEGHPLAAVPPLRRGLDAEMVDRLRALGYADSAKPE